MPWSQSLQALARPAVVGEVRAFVRLHLREHALEHLADAVCLVVSELATNAIVHAKTPFAVGLECDGKTVFLTVRDRASSAPSMLQAPDASVSGRGLVIVAGMSDEWGVRRGPGPFKTVWASFSAEKAVAEAS